MKTLMLLLAVLRIGTLAAQATNPAYLSQFPTVERVKKAMEVSDPRETALRQMGAFWQLQEIIKELSGPREFRGFLPEEGKLIGAYYAAQSAIGQAADSAFPGPYGNSRKLSWNTPYGYMRGDRRFGVEGIQVFQTLLTPEIQQRFAQAVGAEQARHQAIAKADTENMMRAQAQIEASQQGQTHLSQEQAQIRRCVESGRSEMQCMVEGIGKSWNEDFIGKVMPGLKKQPIYGVRVSGVYPGSNKFSLTFYTESVTLTCGDLVPQSLTYSGSLGSNGLRIVIPNGAKPLVLSPGADGRLVGPGPVDITGQVIVGYQEGVRTWSDGRTEPISRPIYEARTRRCSVGTLAASGPSPVLGSMSTAPAAALNFVFGSPDKDAGKPAPPGLRLSGEYGSQSGLDLEFRPEGVVVGCRDATVLRPYIVQAQGTQIVVTVQNGAAPFAMAMGADGRLAGSGTIQVDGRVVTGTDGSGNITYAPRSASCALGNIGPATGESSGPVAPTGDGEPPAPPASGSAGATRAVGSGNAVLAVTIGIPAPAGMANPFAGQNIVLLNASLESILTTSGVRATAGTSLLKALGTACQKQTPECRQAVLAIGTHSIGALKTDLAGRGQFPGISPGTYYLFGSAPSSKGPLVWSLKVELKTGNNSVVLDERNAQAQN